MTFQTTSQFSRHSTIHICLFLTRLANEFTIFLPRTLTNYSFILKNYNWDMVTCITDVNEGFRIFNEILGESINKFCPLIKKKKQKHKRHPWVTSGISISSFKKNKLYKKYLNNPNALNKNNYLKYKNLFTKTIRAAENLYFLNEFTLNKSNIKKTWDLIKTTLNKKNSFSEIIIEGDDGIITDRRSICNKFNELFSCANPEADDICLERNFKSFLSPSVTNSFFLVDTNESEILHAVKNFKNSKSSGVDNISNFLLKKLINSILKPLNYLINLSFKYGQFPNCFKISKIIPLFKSGCKKSINNYRPISLISSISKLMEKLMHSRLNKFLENHDILTKFQYGFRKNVSTEFAILDLTHYIISNIESKLHTIGIFIDLKKAFDSLDHNILLAKLDNYGIRGIAFQWFKSYLADRFHFVAIDECSSDLLPMESGVPQGSILGPLLFNIFLNDLVNCSNISKFILYADDTTILLNDPNIEHLMSTANAEMCKIYNWLSCNKLKMNFKKTCFILFGPKIITNLLNANLVIHNTTIDRVDHTKFLGVIISSTLSWHDHIAYIKQKISKNIGIIYKLKKKFTRDIVRTLYYSLIFPYLIYCLPIWGNSPSCHLSLLEKSQNWFLRILFDLKKYDHISHYFDISNILTINKLYQLNLLLLFYKLITTNTCKYFYNIIGNFIYIASRSLRNTPVFRLPMSRTFVHKNSTIASGMKLWNKLPEKVKDSKTSYKFKLEILILIKKNYFG